jgi:hypothetical protein
MHYNQFHEQFNRIFKLIHPDDEELISYSLDTRDRHGNDNSTDYVFEAKDFCCFSDFLQREFLILEFTDKDENGDWVLEEGSGVSLKITSLLEQNKNGNISFEKMRKEIDKQLSEIRDLFLANCIPSNDSELDKIKIENLKSINW